MRFLPAKENRNFVGRYELIGELASGGMAVVYLARLIGAGGFQRLVALKRLHPHLSNEPEFVEMFLDEARLAAGIHHPNVVPIVEVGTGEDSSYYLVMEYIEGDTLAGLMSKGAPPAGASTRVLLRVLLDSLAGLHAAHDLVDERGDLIGLVHRDCSPQNILVGLDGTSRLTDFGVARATARLSSTRAGQLKGKIAYLSPEQTRGGAMDRRADVFAMGIILWEILTRRRLFRAETEAETLRRLLVEPIQLPSQIDGSVPRVFDGLVRRALEREADKRYQSAAELALAIEAAAARSPLQYALASHREVAQAMRQLLGTEIDARREMVREFVGRRDPSGPYQRVTPQPPAVAAGPRREELTMAASPQGVERSGPHLAHDDQSEAPVTMASGSRSLWLGASAAALALVGVGVAVTLLSGTSQRQVATDSGGRVPLADPSLLSTAKREPVDVTALRAPALSPSMLPDAGLVPIESLRKVDHGSRRTAALIEQPEAALAKDTETVAAPSLDGAPAAEPPTPVAPPVVPTSPPAEPEKSPLVNPYR